MQNFSRSQSLPYPQDYSTKGKNPIFSCLLDQMKHDQELSEKYPSQRGSRQRALLYDIISALETERIHWPSSFNVMSSEQWIQKMWENPKFYMHHARNSSEMREYENLLLDLAAQTLKREIKLFPFLDQDEGFVFNPRFYTRRFSIMACQRLKHNTFFLSIEKEQCTSE